MSRTKYLKGACQHCGIHIEFPVEAIGTVTSCPSCGKETELLLAPPPEEPALPRRVLIYTAVAVFILVLGLGLAILGLQRAEKWAARHSPQPEPAPLTTNPAAAPAQPAPAAEEVTLQDDFAVSKVDLQKTPGSTLVYAVGSVSNTLDKQRFGVRVELDLLDAAGQKIGTATDYRQILDPGGLWQFKALVVESKATTAKVGSIKEQ